MVNGQAKIKEHLEWMNRHEGEVKGKMIEFKDFLSENIKWIVNFKNS